MDLVSRFPARGADTERRSDRGQTALGCAVFVRSQPSVEVLLKAGADPDTGGPSARELAALFGHSATSALLNGE